MIQIGQTQPFYDLQELKMLLKTPKTRHITFSSFQTAVEIGFASHKEMVDVVLKLVPADFHKTMPSEKIEGTFHDVYRKNIKGITIYIKLQKSLQGKGVIISFKKK